MNQYSHNDQYTYPSLQEVEVQLDILNKTSTQINELERRLEISRDAYRKVLSDQSDKLQKLRKKLGKCISRTRAYNELKQKQAYYRREIQLAALKYDNAISTLDTTRNTLAKLEACVSEPGVRDPNTLESLNQSIIDFNNANKLLNNAKLEHEKLMEIYAANEQSLRYLEKRHCFDIRKAKPYYTMYDRFMVKMEDAKIHVELCTDKLKACKIIYANAMSTLESLSNSIHSMRFNQQQQQQSMMYMTTNHCDAINSSDHCSIVNDCHHHHHQHPLDEHGDDDDGVEVEDVNNCTTTQFTPSLSSVQCTNELTNNENSLLNKSMRDCLNHHHHQNNNNNHNSNVNCFPMMNGLLESIHQASIEIDSLQNSSFLLSQEDSPYSSTSTPSNTTTITTATVSSSSSTSSSLCTENNSCSECLSISSHTSSASISPALSFDAFNAASTTPTTTSLDEHQQHHNSAFMLINSLTNLNLMTTTSTTSSDLYTVKDLCCHSNLTMTNIF
ncbi:unnamed protein product [Schistosoma turkestanicum]|nr:unnamed protein product [Schistosoma turkestanicum]